MAVNATNIAKSQPVPISPQKHAYHV